jgi:hypothetical protein
VTRIRSQLSRSSVIASSLGIGLGFVLGACFNGLAAEGLPCETDAQCGPKLQCIDDYCGGVYACADGSIIELDVLCDGTPDCPDASDEDPDACDIDTPDAPNECEDGQPLAWLEGPSYPGASQPIKVVAENFVDGGIDDVLVAGKNGDFLKIVSFGTGPGTEMEYYLNGDPPSFGTRTVADFEAADLEGDGDLDIVVATRDAIGVGVHTFENTGLGVPAEFGPPGDTPAPGVQVRGIELGHFNSDNWIDGIAIIDDPNGNGQVFTGIGDPTAVSMGNSYFTLEFSSVQLNYTTFFDSAAVDIDDDGQDDLIVTGEDMDGFKIWGIRRNGELFTAWDPPVFFLLPGPAIEFDVGFLDGDQFPDGASIDGMGGRIVPLISNPPGFEPQQPIEGFGTGLSGITLADVNCDGRNDFLVNVSNPAEVRIWLGDGAGGVEEDIELTIPSVGVPSGGLAVSQFDLDQTWDVIQAVDMGNQLAAPEIRVWFTSDPLSAGP